MDDLAALRPLALALAIGLLVGLERGWQARDAEPGSRVAGFRTFGLLGLTGGAAALLPTAFATVLLIGATGLLLIGYLQTSRETLGRSMTGQLAAILTLALGFMAGRGDAVVALAAAAVLVLLLSMRHQLHRLLRGISQSEIEAISRFAIVALVILPLMPNRSFGPYGAWNPRELWFVVVLVSGLSFVGYAASRRLGPTRGLLTTAVVGALVSSTAVTAAYARRLNTPSDEENALVAGIALASAVMFLRVLLLTGLLAARALPTLALSMLPALVTACALALLAMRRMPPATQGGELALGNPLDFRPALLLALFVAGLAAASHWAEARFGNAGIGLLLTLAGFADVDAAVITLAKLPRALVADDQAGLLLAAPILANTLLKAGLAIAIAPNKRGMRAALPLIAAVASAVPAIAWLALG